MKKITWQSPSNIALIKYWGKKDIQIPTNPSISFTLENSFTKTSVTYEHHKGSDNPEITFKFEGVENIEFAKRISKFINSISTHIPILNELKLNIDSRNSFPHSTGIASSASAMSALALCLVSIEKDITGEIQGFNDFFEKASYIARLGSGSAARSVYGGINLWGKTDKFDNSCNEFSIDISEMCHPVFKSYQDAVLIVSDHIKKVSSTVGHSLMNGHPYAKNKFDESFRNTELMIDILKSGDLNKFTDLVESEALSLHAMMMTSNPNFILMEPNTIEIINRIRAFRQETGIAACFTLDAGANVHLLYPEDKKLAVEQFIKNEIEKYCVKRYWISDKVGGGPKKIV